MSTAKRIDQWLANLGYCSRREAKAWVSTGRIAVEGQAIWDPGLRSPAAAVRVDGDALDHPDGLLLLLNKPAGMACSHAPREAPLVFDLLPPRWRQRNPALASVGRLDRDTTGLLLITDQPPLIHRLTSPKHKIPKTYVVSLTPPSDPAAQAAITGRFASGTLLLADDGGHDPHPCLPAPVTWQAPDRAEVILQEGRYHQIKRMFAACELTVLALHRSRFGSLSLPDSVPLSTFTTLPLDYPFS